MALTLCLLAEQGTVLEGLEQNRSKFYEVFKQLADKIIGLEEYAQCNQSI